MVALEGTGRKSIQKNASKTATVVHSKATGPNIHSNCTADAMSVCACYLHHAAMARCKPATDATCRLAVFDEGDWTPVYMRQYVYACMEWGVWNETDGLRISSQFLYLVGMAATFKLGYFAMHAIHASQPFTVHIARLLQSAAAKCHHSC